jgi:hypothetical protein
MYCTVGSGTLVFGFFWGGYYLTQFYMSTFNLPI